MIVQNYKQKPYIISLAYKFISAVFANGHVYYMRARCHKHRVNRKLFNMSSRSLGRHIDLNKPQLLNSIKAMVARPT